MAAPKNPNTQAARDALAAKRAAATRDRILGMSPEDRTMLADLMRKRLEAIPGKIAELESEAADLRDWLATYAPEQAQPSENAAAER
jgi:hypothetical protein